MDDKTLTRDQAELGFLMQYLREHDVPSELLAPSDELPIGTLVVPLLQDERGRDRFLTCNFVPLSEDEVEAVRLLQLFAVVPAAWAGEANARTGAARENVERLLHAINGRTAIGHFGIKDDGEIHLRYVYCAPASKVLPKEEILGVVDLFVLTLDTFAETIDGVASGALRLEEALQ